MSLRVIEMKGWLSRKSSLNDLNSVSSVGTLSRNRSVALTILQASGSFLFYPYYLYSYTIGVFKDKK